MSKKQKFNDLVFINFLEEIEYLKVENKMEKLENFKNKKRKLIYVEIKQWNKDKNIFIDLINSKYSNKTNLEIFLSPLFKKIKEGATIIAYDSEKIQYYLKKTNYFGKYKLVSLKNTFLVRGGYNFIKKDPKIDEALSELGLKISKKNELNQAKLFNYFIENSILFEGPGKVLRLNYNKHSNNTIKGSLEHRNYLKNNPEIRKNKNHPLWLNDYSKQTIKSLIYYIWGFFLTAAIIFIILAATKVIG
ncbi:MAG: hypothetical protein K4H23_04710 [Mollicutes bacterium PWAP]|nr:hypothetical protein [Mollicutes bacterium PWAP]